jgi:hypothetical protein
MEIYNGARRTVTYFGKNLPPSDLALLRELGDAESDPPAVVVLPPIDAPRPDVVVADQVAAVADEMLETREHRLALATARVAGSPRVRLALGVVDVAPAAVVVPPAKTTVRPVVAVADEEEAAPTAVILTTRDGKRILCRAVEESGLWLVATTTAGKQLRMRARDVVRIEEPGR